MEITITEHKGFRIVSLEGEFSLYNVRELKEILLNGIDVNTPVIVVDMGGVSYMDSSAIGVLYTAKKKLITLSKDLFLARVSGELQDVMKLSGINFNLVELDSIV